MLPGSRKLTMCAVTLTVLLRPSAVAQQALPGTDITSWDAANIASRLSFIGTFTPMDGTALFLGPYYGIAKLGPEQREGIVLAGWAYNGSPSQVTQKDSTPTRAAVLAQQPDGTLADATAQLFVNPATNGIGSVVVADFNGDGLDDVVLPAHNESPFVLKSSVAFMSRPDGSLGRIDIPDAVMNHDAQLYRVNGVNKIIASSFGTQPHGGTEPEKNQVYTWNGSNFTVRKFDEIGAMSTVAGRFGSGTDEYVVVTDVNGAPDRPYSPTNERLMFAYRFNNENTVRPSIPMPRPYFNGRPEYAQYVSYTDPYSKTHNVRTRAIDLNKDGLLDLVVFGTIWSNTGERYQKGVYQQLVNRGNMQFSDDTDALSPGLSKDSLVDYNARFFDVDGSGIETLLAASHLATTNETDAARQGQSIIVNDGTGRFTAVMHAEFKAMVAQVAAFVRPKLPAGYSMNANITPMFIPYRTPGGLLNFGIVIRLNGQGPATFALANLPLGINLTTDVRQDMTVPSRNGSRRIRTFAGNDTIHRTAVTDPDCSVDGGLGRNVAVYPGPRSAWSVNQAANGSVVIGPAQGPGGVDTLTRIHVLRFADGDVGVTQ